MDLNGDGNIDLLSGSWPGELFLFVGGPDRTFSPPEMIQDKDGEYVNIGGGIRDWQNGGILIAGHAEWENTDEGHFVTYRGKRYESTPEKPVATTGTASAVHAADWDGDGDLDLLVGEIGGKVYLVPNEGTPTAYSFGKEQQLKAKGRPLRVEGDAGPYTADWDGDGDLDLFVGAGDGSVSFYRNTGSPQKPELAAAVKIVSSANVSYGADAPSEPSRGIRSKVCVADWNGDGRLDLLLGDFTTQKPDLPEPTPEEKVEHDKLRKELAAVQAEYGKVAGKIFGPNRAKKKKKELDEARKKMQELISSMQELRGKLPPEYENHGWVWLFLRQPSDPLAEKE